MDEVVLVGFWSSPYVMRVKIALIEKGVEFVYKEEKDIFEKKSELLLKSNPIHKKVPILIHHGRPICESLIILQYIDEVWKQEKQLFSNDPYDRARARFWIDLFDKKVSDCGRRMWASKGADQDAAKKEFVECLKLLENELGEKPYFAGDYFGLLDIALLPITCRFYTYETFCKFSVEKECPRFMAWAKRCNQRESVSMTLPDPYKVYDFTLEVKKRLKIE
ncbi:probable glutathione S-transferase [Cajanus cajan]|uniref:glutathione transferase n=1 Tax=Cajanus cajan TaxID=3821 RepID=A0A151TDJ6_CAJCA|nr:probable glutathione S-transferase [Cajanus cajan]KYP65107.1 putative glutathione S-transferase [Cajanus cajan]